MAQGESIHASSLAAYIRSCNGDFGTRHELTIIQVRSYECLENTPKMRACYYPPLIEKARIYNFSRVGLVIRKSDRIQAALLVALKSVHNLNTVLVRIYRRGNYVFAPSRPFVFLARKTLSTLHLFSDKLKPPIRFSHITLLRWKCPSYVNKYQCRDNFDRN